MLPTPRHAMFPVLPYTPVLGNLCIFSNTQFCITTCSINSNLTSNNIYVKEKTKQNNYRQHKHLTFNSHTF